MPRRRMLARSLLEMILAEGARLRMARSYRLPQSVSCPAVSSRTHSGQGVWTPWVSGRALMSRCRAKSSSAPKACGCAWMMRSVSVEPLRGMPTMNTAQEPSSSARGAWAIQSASKASMMRSTWAL
ncbi:MAG: hypothetical protein KatS3mg103_0691 [Phycisphaerales bacterium]|nr:MAG: hypothetical protein KatS3mg103_0691 [Phycisphaerales bacterium]